MDNAAAQKEASKVLVVAAFAAIYLIWGSTYIGILIAIKDIPPFLMAGIRFLIAGLLLFLFSRIRGESIPGWRSIGKMSFTGLLTLTVGNGSVAWVEQYISSGLASIIVASSPLWFVLLDRHQWKYNFSNKWIIVGLLIGFTGVLTLFSDQRTFNVSGNRMQLVSVFVLVAGTIAWVIGSLYSKYKPAEGSTVIKVTIQMIAAGLCSTLLGFLSGEHHHTDLSALSRESMLAMLYLITIGSLVGYMAYIWLLSVRPPALVGTYAYVNPVVAVFLGWLIAGEQISQQQVVALAVILSGVILVTLSNYKKKRA